MTPTPDLRHLDARYAEIMRVLFPIQKFDGGGESRPAKTGNMSGAAPEAEQSPSVTGFDRMESGESALATRAGVASSPSDITPQTTTERKAA